MIARISMSLILFNSNNKAYAISSGILAKSNQINTLEADILYLMLMTLQL
jgi:hypothetical protein